jgi:hypothetical protein
MASGIKQAIDTLRGVDPKVSSPTSLGYLPMILLGVLAAVVGLALAPNVLVDDAAISFRYADRIVAGHGFTYNDHERVLGASNPLWTLLLALLHAVGINLELAARGLALVLFIVCALLAMHVAKRLSTPLGGILAGVLLVIDPFFRDWALSGMESVLATALGLAVVASLLHGRTRTAGVFLGLAVFNKLDAGLLAVAVAGAWVLVRRRFPFMLTAISLAVALPWFVFATIYFGSLVPNSMLTKMQGGEGVPFDRLEIVHFLMDPARLAYVLLAAALVWYYRRLDPPARLATVTLAGWFLLHALALSIVNLGAPYPWYKTVLIPPIIILACAFVGRVFAERPSRVAVAAQLGVAALLTFSVVTVSLTTVRDSLAGNPITVYEAFEADRRAAGEFIARHAAPDEVVSSGFGWIAFPISNHPFNDLTGLNSRDMLPNAAYYVTHGSPYDKGGAQPEAPPGYVPLTTFKSAHRLDPDFSWFTVFGRPDSEIARLGPNVSVPLFNLPPPKPFSEDAGLRDVVVRDNGDDLYAHPPSGATFTIKNERQPVSVTFTPSFLSKVPAEGTDGVTFKVWSGGQRVYQSHVRPDDPISAVTLNLPKAPTLNESKLSFITKSGPAGNRAYDWAIWRDVRIVIGETDKKK